MPSNTPKPDVSTTWPVHEKCGHRHLPGGSCPNRGWLVAEAPADRVDVEVRPPR